MTPQAATIIAVLDWTYHRVVFAALGYLAWGWRGSVIAIVARELLALAVRLVRPLV